MFYIKAKLNEQVEIKIDLYEDDVFTTCPGCKKELHVTTDIMAEVLQDTNSDFAGTSIYCVDCSERRSKEKL